MTTNPNPAAPSPIPCDGHLPAGAALASPTRTGGGAGQHYLLPERCGPSHWGNETCRECGAIHTPTEPDGLCDGCREPDEDDGDDEGCISWAAFLARRTLRW